MEQNNILVRDLCKQFDGFLLDHVSFQVPKGRIVGFIGENGAGKSTTINLILDELKKDSGQIQIFGMDNTISSVREEIGVVFDECNFHDVFHVSDSSCFLREACVSPSRCPIHLYPSFLHVSITQACSLLSLS